jgi:hypothetical protein
VLIVEAFSGGIVPTHVRIVGRLLVKPNVSFATVRTTYISQILISAPVVQHSSVTSATSYVPFTIMTGISTSAWPAGWTWMPSSVPSAPISYISSKKDALSVYRPSMALNVSAKIISTIRK